MSDLSVQTLFAVFATGMLLGGLPAWFFTAIHWYRKGMADSRSIWEHALRESAETTSEVAKLTIDSWIMKSEEMIARHRAGQPESVAPKGDAP